MDYTGAESRLQGSGILQGETGVKPVPFPGHGPQPGQVLSSFAHEPQDRNGHNPNGPVLVIPSPPARQQPSLWMHRIWLAVFVLFSLEVGIILTLLPWTRIWTENSLLLGYPQLREFLTHNFVRGLISGLGLVDIWMGVAEAVRYREGSDI